MRVLAIDTALAACSAAVLDTANGGLIASESLPMLRGHAEALMPLVARVMKTSGLAFGDLERVVVTTGPGSFTGLRVGISAGRGLGVAINVPVVGVTTLAAYAAPYLAEDDQIPVVAAIDARRDHVYLQVFGAGGRTLITPRVAPLNEAVRAAAETPARIVGSAANTVALGLAETAVVPVIVDAREAPDIGWVAQIGAVVAEVQAPPKPQYLRAPDAQPQNAASVPRR
ncbi:MAG TPA: tRNA (adenosine(37)-N6)-threonylcarbamoyltransferase complex dimerization subunit type 1 TsaB [Xanthobacteraceae bacterium]|jgi:tRNA threonylcarbamoyladenosine biosynthesis protein TsaB|nr:tRNA (adenosine(37)-N6)-threonylcarbamoyltransferase complex dimerization subunit type 1 TsaB [Xanthobacteraceae bacterium]